MQESKTIRLYDLGENDHIQIRCPCGRSTEYGPGFLQRTYRFPSDMLVYDLQYRMKCAHCNRREGFGIEIVNVTARGAGLNPLPCTVVVKRKV